MQRPHAHAPKLQGPADRGALFMSLGDMAHSNMIVRRDSDLADSDAEPESVRRYLPPEEVAKVAAAIALDFKFGSLVVCF